MEDENVVPAAAGRKKPFILFRLVQWAMVAVGAFMLLLLSSTFKHLGAPNAPIALFWLTVAAIVGLSAAHSPPVFFRLPGKIKVLAYVGLLPGFILLGTVLGQIQESYERTPEGAKEAEVRRQDEALAAIEASKAAAEEATILAAQQATTRSEEAKTAKAEALTKVKGCLSLFGHYKPLEEAVKGRLHNPHAFEHVSTEVIGPTPDDYNMEMRFRAENGFGALRTGSIRAKVNPVTCELESTGGMSVD